MKIYGNSPLTSWYSRVFEREGNGREERRGSGRQNSSKEEYTQSRDPDEFQVTDEQIQRAIDLFSKDTQAVGNGLSANLVGEGAGLRVVLKDSEGHTLRSLRPSEFLALQRESQVSPNTVLKGVGKILDRKY